MPRILRILNRFNLGGPTYNAAYLTKYLDNHYETLLVGGANGASEKNSQYIVNQLGIDPLIIPSLHREVSPADDFRSYRHLTRIIREFNPHIVHTHASKAGAIGRLAAIHQNVPVIVHTFHGHVFESYFGPLKTSMYKNIERYLAKKTNRIIAISETQKNDLTQRFQICSEEKVSVIPLGFDLSRFRENQDEKRAAFRKKYMINDDEIAIGIIGRLVPIKNHSMFLDALKMVQGKTSKKIRAFIVGDGETREILKLRAINLGIDHVNGIGEYHPATLTFTSWITEMDYVNAGLDIVALTSLNEGTPVSIIEAQAAGKPVVTTRVGGIEDVVIPNETALLSEKDNTLEFAEKLLQLIENEELRVSFGRKGWGHIAEKYHYSRLVRDMEVLYDRLLDKKLIYPVPNHEWISEAS
ncbi:MAG: glycosyltransferase [Bacteroidales bacterium]|nr:glycosyltransferase [Bacteroidales bacterium]